MLNPKTKWSNGHPRQSITRWAEVVDLEITDEEIKPGDKYIAARNCGPRILTCKKVNPKNWIEPEEKEYFYDTWECKKLKNQSITMDYLVTFK